MLLLALLSACDAEKPDLPVDTGAPDRGDDTGAPEAWVAPDPGCELSRPLVLTEVPDIHTLRGPDLLHFAYIGYEFPNYEADWGCPVDTRDTAAGAVTWEGDCAFDTFGFEGRWYFAERAFPDGSGAARAEATGLRFYDSRLEDFPTVADIDGSVDYTLTSAGGYTFERDYTWDAEGDVGLPGAWTVRGVEELVPGVRSTFVNHADIRTEDLDGDYCLVLETAPHGGCGDEPWGGWVLQGQALLVVTFDPHVTCDGCGTATLDGVEIGEVCGAEYGAWVP